MQGIVPAHRQFVTSCTRERDGRGLESPRLSAMACQARVMDTTSEVLRILDEVLSLRGRSASFTRSTHLVGALPEFDSMAVVSLITALEEQLGIVIDDDEIDGQTFATVGSLADFVSGKLAA